MKQKLLDIFRQTAKGKKRLICLFEKITNEKQEWSFHSHSCLVVLWLLEKSFTEEPNLQLSSQHTGQITALRSQLVYRPVILCDDRKIQFFLFHTLRDLALFLCRAFVAPFLRPMASPSLRATYSSVLRCSWYLNLDSLRSYSSSSSVTLR